MPRRQDFDDTNDDGQTIPPLPDLTDQLTTLSESDTSGGENFSDTDGY